MSYLIDKLTSGIIIVDENLIIHEWNNWLSIHTDISRENAIGKRLDELFSYINTQTLKRRIKTTIMLDTPTFYNPTDGYLIKISNDKITDSYFEYMRQSIKIVPLENKRALIIINDHTSIDEIMHKLEDANSKLKTYLQVIDRYVYTVELDRFGYILDASSAFCKLNGTSKSELKGKNWLTLISPDMSIDILNEFKVALTHQNSCFSGEIKMKLLNKKEYWFRLSLFALTEEKNTNFQAILEDITDKKRIEELSITDELTKLYNRRYFNEMSQRELNRAKREKRWFTFMVMDVDNFKLYNDYYGHLKGDEALIKVAQVLSKILKRGGDFAFRLGGEEFGAIIASQTSDSGYAVSEHIRKAIEALRVEHIKNLKYNVVTVSIGVATINFAVENNYDIDMDEIYRYADEALYESKNSGRNKVTSKIINQGGQK